VKLKEIKLKLIEIDKNVVWLASQLGYSRQYLYTCILNENKKELKRVEKIIKKVENGKI